MAASYVELNAHSFYSFGLGASHVHDLVMRARELEYPALALTDTNMCGAMEFARTAKQFGVRPITGGEITLADGSRITLLAKNQKGYANICTLFTKANEVDRQNPLLDPAHLPDHSDGLVLLTGGREGHVSKLVTEGRHEEAAKVLTEYMDWFGPESVHVELCQNYIRGDTKRNYTLAKLACNVGAKVVATNSVHYHSPERFKLQHALVAVRNNLTLNQVIGQLRLSRQSYLKSPEQMQRLFRWCPDAIQNTLVIYEMCEFDLTRDLGYRLPTPPVPEGHTPESYLRQLAYEAVQRRYGRLTQQIEDRLQKEFRLIERHDLAGFVLVYHEIVKVAHQIMVEDGLISPETPLEENPPGRGRGSSVALLIGYLLGLSHVDPLLYDLPLDRFMPEDMTKLPDIDLDFPRKIREKLIARIHERYGKERAVLVGAISKYKMKGVLADLGKALGISKESLKMLGKSIELSNPEVIELEMGGKPAIQGQDRGGWMERPDRSRPSAARRSQEARPARRGNDSEHFSNSRDGPCSRGCDRRALHHGLGQAQHRRRQLRQDRPAVTSSPRPDGRGPPTCQRADWSDYRH